MYIVQIFATLQLIIKISKSCNVTEIKLYFTTKKSLCEKCVKYISFIIISLLK